MRSDGTNEMLATIGLIATLAGASAAGAAVIHVDAGAPGGGDGATWETAYDDLRDALAAAGGGDEIWVVAGVYRPAGPGGSRSATFTLPTGVALYGGFVGDETSRGERDWRLNETILSGDLDGDDGQNRENNDENSYHVLTGVFSDDVVLDGFTVSGGNASGGGGPHGGGLYAIDGGDLTLRNCVFRDNEARIDGGGVFVEDGLRLAVESCAFTGNAAAVGAGLHAYFVGAVTAVDSTFNDNVVDAGGAGGFASDCGPASFVRCEFSDNHAGGIGSGGGLIVGLGEHVLLIDCLFAHNAAGSDGGGLGLASAATLINCSFSRNAADRGGAIIMGADEAVSLINCSLGHNQGGGIETSGYVSLDVTNSIVWGNTPAQFGGSREPTVSYSDVEGGWPGEGNIDADPLFVQPGTDDLRLAFGSPCVDAGNNAEVPPDIEYDLDGNPRIQNGTVDMGAYEGEYDAEPARAEDEDIDDGEGVPLVPNGGGFEPEENTLVIFNNRSGEDDAWASLTEYESNRHPGARGFSSLGITAALETSIDDGGFFAQMFIPFHEDDLDGVDPFTLDLTYYDEGVGNWALAVGRNTARSPGHRSVFGDRITREGPGPWGLTLDVGDYGVFFNPETRGGFVWANVDHAADFSSGVALCPADTHQPPDSNVDFDDILAVIDNWGAGPGPFDVNGDGSVNADDLFQVLSNWGGCE